MRRYLITYHYHSYSTRLNGFGNVEVTTDMPITCLEDLGLKKDDSNPLIRNKILTTQGFPEDAVIVCINFQKFEDPR